MIRAASVGARFCLSFMENGLTKEEVVAAITHIAFYAGWPTAVSGFAHLNKILDQP